MGTEGHIFPAWLRRRTIEMIEALPQEQLDPAWRQWPKIVLKPVCKDCQKRLNEVFEDPGSKVLKRMLDGSTVLTPRDQVLLAGWIVKTEFLYYLRRKGQSSEAIRVGLLEAMKLGTPPPDTTARVAQLGSETPATSHVLANAPDPSGYVFTGVNGFLGVLTETILWIDLGAQVNHLSANQDRRFLTVWPPSVTKRRWPPSVPLNSSNATTLRAELDHPTKLVGSLTLQVKRPEIPPGQE